MASDTINSPTVDEPKINFSFKSVELWRLYQSLLDGYEDFQNLKTYFYDIYLNKYDLSMAEIAWAHSIYRKAELHLASLSNHKNESDVKKYLVNLSLFRSIPDNWGISQGFPIFPLQDLHKPVSRTILFDLTCDSDGFIKRNENENENENGEITVVHYLPDLSRDDRNYLAIFMVGAYQEVIGSNHNLFGDINRVSIKFDNNSFYIDSYSNVENIVGIIKRYGFTKKTMSSNYMDAFNDLLSYHPYFSLA